MKYRILTDVPGATDGCQWYRGVGPISHLAKSNPDIEVPFGTYREYTWGEIKAADILFMIRPCLESQLATIEMAKNVGTKVWIDYDDDLFAVTADNPNHVFFANPGIERNIERALNISDAVSVSTKALQKKLQPMSKAQVRVIPNSIDPSSLRHRPTKSPQENIVMWRGTSTHLGDLMTFASEIKQVSRDYEKIVFAFVGYNPWFITQELGPRAIKFPPVEMLKFYEAICALRPRISIVPLMDNDFNRSKSNIAALEASVAGSAILAPDWEEWEIPGIMRYSSPTEFQNLLETMIEEKSLSVIAEDTWNHVSKHFILDVVNPLRAELVRSLK